MQAYHRKEAEDMEHATHGNKLDTRTLAMASLLAALACVATMVIKVPSPTGGYMNLGDAVVLLSAYLLGPVWGAVAAGLGSALADLFSGYTAYVPATLAIKALMAAAAALIYSGMRRRTVSLLVCSLAAEAIMVAGYWLYDGLLLGSLAASAAGIPSNLVQSAFAIAASTALTAALRRSAYVRREFPRL